MKTNKEDPKSKNHSRTITMSLRTGPELKCALAEEAGKLGITLGEYIELILINGANSGITNTSVKNEIKQYENQVLEINALFAAGSAKLQKEKEEAEKEVEQLKVQNTGLENQLLLLKDPQLLHLFSQLKGKDDTIIRPDGTEYSFTYQTPEDLLWVMINSYEL